MLKITVAALAGIAAALAGPLPVEHVARDQPADGYFQMATGQDYTGVEITVGFYSGACSE